MKTPFQRLQDQSITIKSYYLINELSSFRTNNGDRVRYYSINDNTLTIEMNINPTDDLYLTSDTILIDTKIVYNLTNDTIKITCHGTGAKKYNYNTKRYTNCIIQGIQERSANNFLGDLSNSEYMTSQYLYNLIQSTEASKEEKTLLANQINYDLNYNNISLSEAFQLIKELNNKYQSSPNTTQEPAETTIKIYYTVGNKSFTTYTEAEEYCNQVDFDPELMIIEEAQQEPLNNLESTSTTNNTITYQLYKHTFTTYSDAYNYAIKHDMPETMILASNYPMTYERLLELNQYYIFSPSKMPYEYALEYFEYISQCKHSLDQETRYYKLRDLIQRKEYHIRQRKEAEQLQKQKCNEIDYMFKSLYNHGVTSKENTYSVSYYYNNELLYNWSSGITIDKQHEQLTKVYNDFISQLQAV